MPDPDTLKETTGEDALAPMGSAPLRVLLDNATQFKRFLRQHLPSEAAAEDLLQIGLVQALKKAGELRNADSAVSWFYRILRNLLTDFYRSRASEIRKNDSFRQDILSAGEDFTPPTDGEIHAEACACMGRLIPTLRPEYGHLIQRIDLKGEGVAEVAESLGITANNLSVRLHRARNALKTGLERTCGACTRHGCLDCTCSGSGGAHGDSR